MAPQAQATSPNNGPKPKPRSLKTPIPKPRQLPPLGGLGGGNYTIPPHLKPKQQAKPTSHKPRSLTTQSPNPENSPPLGGLGGGNYTTPPHHEPNPQTKARCPFHLPWIAH